uniref:Uncharacterized protein n=1 Tax=Globisporangium ultimum (strain ATCC 200006 / CBS 805.95 / DAOM BR144) TaxID=431595 RepID=K3WKC2_GLOUD
MPFACLLLITFIDAVTLVKPDEGTNANYVHWGRNYLIVMFISLAVLGQFPLSVPGLRLGAMRNIVTSLWASLGGVSFQFLMSHVIGFLLPFSLVIGTPVWIAFICIDFAFYFGNLLRDNAQVRIDLSNYFVVFITQVSLTLIYSTCIYGSQAIDSVSQNVYIILLLIIKISLKNWMSRYLGEMDGLKPEIVILNVEIFNALYMSLVIDLRRE